MWVNCYLCTICNGANLFYQVFTSSRNTHLHLRALSAVPGRDARSVWFSWGLKGKPAPGAACLAACHGRCSAGAGSERLTFPKAVLCACRNQALLTSSHKPSSKVRELPHRKEYLFPLSLPFPPDPFSHYFVPCPEQKVEGCNPKSPSLRVALQTQLLQELHLENELPGEFKMLSTGLFNLSERAKILIKESDELYESTWPLQNTCDTFAENNASKGEAFSRLV